MTLGVAALSEDGARFSLRNEFFRADGKLAARKLVAPPQKLLAALRSLPRTEDFPG